jgi:membrane protein YdbS with pleckstrin-like domain
MTNLTEAKMEKPENEGSNVKRVMWMLLAALGIVFTGGAIAGFLSEHQSEGAGAFSGRALGVLTVFVAVICALAYAIWRNAQNLKTTGEQLNRRERLNIRIVAACGVVGGLIGLILAISGDLGGQDANIFSSGPISPAVAIGLAIVIGLLMPLVSWYWHMRVIDEQESKAYRSGALLAIYAFWTVSPTWWLLWRGGILPAPDGIALYLMTTFIALIVWFYEKYR